MMEEKEEARKVVEALARAKIPHAEAERRWWHAMRQLSVIVDELDKKHICHQERLRNQQQKGN